ncbi:hypothetical protein A5758_00680 [Mycobacterium sp. 852014-50255_SCH5639931]|nr:hypothetical protein A5758_00680 [Mycobacterium sp. 852014-50255_SCH5639931]
MRQSFLAALGTWIFAAIAVSLTGSSWIALATGTFAAAPTALWFAHLTAFSVRTARGWIKTPTITADGGMITHSQRDFFPLFAKAFAAATTATILQTATTKALPMAASGCPDGWYACGSSKCCSGPGMHWACIGYTGNKPSWKKKVDFCTSANSDDDIEDLSHNCRELYEC